MRSAVFGVASNSAADITSRTNLNVSFQAAAKRTYSMSFFSEAFRTFDGL